MGIVRFKGVLRILAGDVLYDVTHRQRRISSAGMTLFNDLRGKAMADMVSREAGVGFGIRAGSSRPALKKSGHSRDCDKTCRPRWSDFNAGAADREPLAFRQSRTSHGEQRGIQTCVVPSATVHPGPRPGGDFFSLAGEH
jgi:hypothetical protein